MHERAAVVIVAAGSSLRMSGRDKLWIPLAGRITLARTIDVFERSPLIDAIVLVMNAGRLDDTAELCKQEAWQKVVAIVSGGTRRQDSVRAGLDALAMLAPTCRWVMIHDGARPLVTAAILEAGLLAAQASQAAVAAVPVKDTIKQVQQGQIIATLDRSQLWAVQTPQVFSLALIRDAHNHPAAQEDVTDDAALLERLGQPVTIFPGSYTNIKITTQEDLLLAETFLTRERSMTSRVGFGYDVHAFAPDRPLVLGGVTVPFDVGLSGHSDADALIHAVVDALLGAAALGDIGDHFPSSDVRWKDQPSSVFLDYTYDLLCQQQWKISNVDATIVAERPKLSPYILSMRTHVAQHLHLSIEQVSVKATTTDGLGFAGRREGIACYAMALIER